ncbi:hypothetical protein WDW86_19795 [Bdellovibrionota bacterium FG-2]
MVLTLLLSVCAMPAIHWQQSRDLREQLRNLKILNQRQALSSELLLELERYRNISGNFRKMRVTEINSAKGRLKSEILGGLARLDQLSPNVDERKTAAKASEQLGEFFILSAKARTLTLQGSLLSTPDRSMSFLLGASGMIISLLFLILLRNYLFFARPVRLLRERSERIYSPKKSTEKTPTVVKAMKGTYGEIEKILHNLAITVTNQRKERFQFVTAVANDLKPPLVTLQAGVTLLASEKTLSTEQRFQAAEVVKRSATRLMRSLEDLTDIVDTEYTEIKLDEKNVDLRDVIVNVAKMLQGSVMGAIHEVTYAFPQVPAWAFIDSARFERILINLVSKIIQI